MNPIFGDTISVIMVHNWKLIVFLTALASSAAVALKYGLLSRAPRETRRTRTWTGIAVFLLILSAGVLHKIYTYEPVMTHDFESSMAEQIASAPATAVAADDWPWWRGPARNSVSTSESAPVNWDTKKNVVWRAKLPGLGHSSPILFGTSVFVTLAQEQSQTQSLVALDRSTGDVKWKKELHRGAFDRKHAKNSHASSTPACDGRHVFAVFQNDGAIHISAVDLSGQIVWQRRVGDYSALHGYGASPVLYKSVVIVSAEGERARRIVAFDRVSGETRWETSFRDAHVSYASPSIVTFDSMSYYIVPAHKAIEAYTPETGELAWSVPWKVLQCDSTPTYDGRNLYVSGGYPNPDVVCIDMSSSNPRIVWRTRANAPDAPSPLAVGGLLFLVSDNGIVSCLNGITGERLVRRRLKGNFSSSPTFAADHLYVANEEGVVYVVTANRKLDVVAEIDIGEAIFSTPVICGSRLYLRTASAIYSIEDE